MTVQLGRGLRPGVEPAGAAGPDGSACLVAATSEVLHLRADCAAARSRAAHGGCQPARRPRSRTIASVVHAGRPGRVRVCLRCTLRPLTAFALVDRPLRGPGLLVAVHTALLRPPGDRQAAGRLSEGQVRSRGALLARACVDAGLELASAPDGQALVVARVSPGAAEWLGALFGAVALERPVGGWERTTDPVADLAAAQVFFTLWADAGRPPLSRAGGFATAPRHQRRLWEAARLLTATPGVPVPAAPARSA